MVGWLIQDDDLLGPSHSTTDGNSLTLTNHLGARQANEVLNIIRNAKAKGLGVIFISHTLPHVLEVTDRIVVLRLGRIVKDAPTSEFNGDTLIGTITGTIQ
ncbi:MAG: hypothetical protein ACKOUD_06335, partial [Rhodoluna sp.]